MSSRIADLKLVVVGDGGVGKSSLLITYATGEFSIEYVRFDEYTANMVVGRQQCSLGLWDTLGKWVGEEGAKKWDQEGGGYHNLCMLWII